MTSRQHPYPGIRRAALAIAVDNGGIFVGRSPRMLYRDLGRFLAKQPAEVLRDAESWLTGIPVKRLQEACAGEQRDAQKALRGSPAFTEDLLEGIFHEVF